MAAHARAPIFKDFMPLNRYTIRTMLVWRTKAPDRKIRVRAASSHSAFVAAAPHLGLVRSVNGLTCQVDRSDKQEVIQAPTMPVARVLGEA